jgi:hypothetical protein
MEQSPEWRYALHTSPTAATVDTESICCMHCSTSIREKVVRRRISISQTPAIPGKRPVSWESGRSLRIMSPLKWMF